MTRPFLVTLILFCLTGIFPLHAGEIPIMPLSEIKPGMIGRGKTVFSGDSIEEFEVKIIGTVKNFLPKKDIILVELLGDRLKHTGLVSGMSGSPVYIEGKLVGALAFGWAFSKDPIGGITPIEQMLEIRSEFDRGDRGAAAPQGGAAAGRGSSGSAVFNPFEPPANPLLDSGSEQARPAAGSFTAGGAVLDRLEVPLIFSGCHPEVLSRYGKIFSRFGLVPLSGGSLGGNSADIKNPSSFQEGSAISAQLVRGDLSLAATGTITWRSGNRILAFGHPFLQYGSVDFPMTAAEVVTVMPSVAQSFKLSNNTAFMGSIKSDQANGIFGIIGSEPAMVPLDIELKASDKPAQVFRYELVRQKNLTPLLGGMTLLNTILSSGGAVSEQTVKVSGKIQIKNSSPVDISNVYAGSGASSLITLQMQTILQYLYGNYFGPAEVEKMSLSLEISEGFPRAQLTGVYLDRSTVYPGDSIRVDILLDPFDKPEIRDQFIFIAPDTDSDERLLLLVGSGDQITKTELQLSPTRFIYTSLDHLVRLLNGMKKNNLLYLKLIRQDQGIILGDREMTGLPPSVWTVLKSEKTAGLMLPINDATVQEFSKPTDFILSGLKIIPIELKARQ